MQENDNVCKCWPLAPPFIMTMNSASMAVLQLL